MDEQAILYDSSRVLTASEIGSYLYCNRSWWLDKVGGYQPANVEVIEQGTTLHEAHGQQVQRASSLNRLGVAMIAGAAFLVFIWIILRVVL